MSNEANRITFRAHTLQNCSLRQLPNRSHGLEFGIASPGFEKAFGGSGHLSPLLRGSLSTLPIHDRLSADETTG